MFGSEGREFGFFKAGDDKINGLMVTYAWDFSKNCYSEIWNGKGPLDFGRVGCNNKILTQKERSCLSTDEKNVTQWSTYVTNFIKTPFNVSEGVASDPFWMRNNPGAERKLASDATTRPKYALWRNQ